VGCGILAGMITTERSCNWHDKIPPYGLDAMAEFADSWARDAEPTAPEYGPRTAAAEALKALPEYAAGVEASEALYSRPEYEAFGGQTKRGGRRSLPPTRWKRR
jgi:hypothetical protein